MTAPRCEVLVVGGGPGGAAAAVLLARSGVHVTVLERAHFPRSKPCAEYLSPEAGRVLERLGVLTAIRDAGAVALRGMRVVSHDGTAFEGRFDAPLPCTPWHDHGLALPRERLDSILLDAARAAGAAVHEGVTVERVGRGADPTVTARTPRNAAARYRARLVIGADGLNSRVAADLGLARRGRRRWLALVSHARGVTGMRDVGEMHVTRDAYVGLAPVGGGLTNVAAVVRLGRGGPARPDAWLAATVARIPEVRARLAQARMVRPVRAVGPFDRRARRARADGALLVGDAADFYDPFTGEGIFAALRGAELATDHAVPALAANRLTAGDLAGYDRDRVRTFGGKWVVERLIGQAVATPALLNHVARRLARRRGLADLLVGVTGDFVPATRVLRPGFLWQLIA